MGRTAVKTKMFSIVVTIVGLITAVVLAGCASESQTSESASAVSEALEIYTPNTVMFADSPSTTDIEAFEATQKALAACNASDAKVTVEVDDEAKQVVVLLKPATVQYMKEFPESLLTYKDDMNIVHEASFLMSNDSANAYARAYCSNSTKGESILGSHEFSTEQLGTDAQPVILRTEWNYEFHAWDAEGVKQLWVVQSVDDSSSSLVPIEVPRGYTVKVAWDMR